MPFGETNYLENDHELYKVVKRKLPGQKKTLEGFKKRQKVVIDLLDENRDHYENGRMYEIFNWLHGLYRDYVDSQVIPTKISLRLICN